MLSEKPWRPDAVLFLLACICLAYCTGIIAVWAVTKYGAVPASQQGFLRFVVGTLGLQGLGLVFIHYFIRWHNVTWREFLGYRRFGPLLLWSVGVSAVAIPGTWLIYEFAQWLITVFQGEPTPQQVLVIVRESMGPAQKVFSVIAAVGIASVFEEALFRGILYPFIKQSGQPALALAGTSLLFGASHLSLAVFLPLTFLGLALTILYEKSDSLLAPIIVHSLFNAVNLIMIFSAAGKPMLTG